jgi:hypothetical protein
LTTLLLLAAVALVGVGIAHSILGERYILMRLFRRGELPRLFGGTEFTRKTLRFAWHVTSIAWWGFAALLVLMSRGPIEAPNVARVIGITLIATGLVALVGSRGRHLSWPIFLAIGGIALMAATP